MDLAVQSQFSSPSEKIIGPLTTKEIQQQASAEQRAKTVKFARDQEQLNLQLNSDGVLEC